MRNKFLLTVVALCIVGITTNAQTLEKPKTTFGFKAGVNLSNLKVKDWAGVESKGRTGVVGGLFIDIPFGRVISVQPEFLYSQMGGKLKGVTNLSQEVDQKLTYFSIPLLLKFNVSRHFSFLVGPQFDFLSTSQLSYSGTSTNNDSKFKKNDIAVAAGIQFWMGRYFGIDARYIYGTKNISQYNSSSLTNYGKMKNQAIQITANIRFGKPAYVAPVVVAPVVIPQVADTDGDGINDNDDKCPAVAGLAKYGGCPIPDTDGDGINDEADKCPTVAGLAKYGGCPIPDTDGDGINDEEDKCPTVAGLARYNGCPIPDTDGDGINDEEDKCKNTAGLANNMGCPEMVFYYKKASATLTAEDKANLDKLVEWMGNHPDLSISIEGHTSTLGATDYNQKLSEKRAQNSVKYLVSKGIDVNRLKAVGYGEQFPIGDNSKEEGRAQSRRVVMRIAQ
jgi:outer membrane protein OmpA-like peptidoglycan-associated protein